LYNVEDSRWSRIVFKMMGASAVKITEVSNVLLEHRPNARAPLVHKLKVVKVCARQVREVSG
jgi:hypothetical protein